LWGVKGSVWARKVGRFGAEYPVPFLGGPKIATTTKSTREAAEAWRAKMEEDAADGEPVVSGSQSVGQYLDEWLRDAVEPSVSRRTYEKRAWAVNLHIKPALGGAPAGPRRQAHPVPLRLHRPRRLLLLDAKGDPRHPEDGARPGSQVGPREAQRVRHRYARKG